MISIRAIRETDAKAYLELLLKLDEETSFMMFEPGERISTEEEQKEKIKEMFSGDNSTILVADNGMELVGFVEGTGGMYRRDKHSVYLVIGLLQSATGMGIGTTLLKELENWALERGIHRLELTVMTRNCKAIGLYRKMGFEVEGTRKDSLSVQGTYVDEFYMAKLL